MLSESVVVFGVEEIVVSLFILADAGGVFWKSEGLGEFSLLLGVLVALDDWKAPISVLVAGM